MTFNNGGKLVKSGAVKSERQLSAGEIDAITANIRASGVMDKECAAQMVADYWAEFKINLDGKQKTIQFPGCQDETKAIMDALK